MYIILQIFTLSLSFASASFIIDRTGNELNGIGNDGKLNNYQAKSYEQTLSKNLDNNKQLRFYKSTALNKSLQTLAYTKGEKSGLVHAVSSDGFRKTLTSAIFKNGKLKSQINCNTNRNSCYVTTSEICQSILKVSGKPSFDAILDETKACMELLNTYDKAFTADINSLNKNAYKEHDKSALYMNSKMGKVASALNMYRELTSPKKPYFYSSGGVKQKSDSRIFGMLQQCKHYTGRHAFYNSPSIIQPSSTTEEIKAHQ